MTDRASDSSSIYRPEIRSGENLRGIAMNAVRGGDQVRVLQKAFVSSYDHRDHHVFDEILNSVFGEGIHALNDLLVVIRRKSFRIYRHFPMVFRARSTTAIELGRPVYENQILDIVAVRFEDAKFDLDIRDGDKFVWLFREKWAFGLYFDFSENLRTEELWNELGHCYKTVKYHTVYSVLSREEEFNRLLDRGWFPFVQILGQEFSRLLLSIEDARNLETTEELLVDEFNDARIEQFSDYWWKNDIFLQKKPLIAAGIAAYVSGDETGAIHCINTLVPQIDGIIRLYYEEDVGGKPSTRELMDYLRAGAAERSPTAGNLVFPLPLVDYIDRVFFRPFDISRDDTELSRHSVAHGAADHSKFTRVRALQLILLLDQIYFYFQNRPRLETVVKQ